jgi:hypothetical protein
LLLEAQRVFQTIGRLHTAGLVHPGTGPIEVAEAVGQPKPSTS